MRKNISASSRISTFLKKRYIVFTSTLILGSIIFAVLRFVYLNFTHVYVGCSGKSVTTFINPFFLVETSDRVEHESCPKDTTADTGAYAYLLKKNIYQDYDSYQGRLNSSEDNYTVTISNNINFAILTPTDPQITIVTHPLSTSPLTAEEKLYIPSGKTACGGLTLFTKPTALEPGTYFYQLRTKKYVHTITYDERQNAEVNKVIGRDILDTFIRTVECKG